MFLKMWVVGGSFGLVVVSGEQSFSIDADGAYGENSELRNKRKTRAIHSQCFLDNCCRSIML
jgi:hypothetical protein